MNVFGLAPYARPTPTMAQKSARNVSALKIASASVEGTVGSAERCATLSKFLQTFTIFC